MKRIHLFEFMDLQWFPKIFRNIQTNILQVLMTHTRAFDCTISYITEQLQKSNTNNIFDLCSGASGPWLRLVDQFPNKQVKVFLTDKFPNLKMFKLLKEKTSGKIDFISDPIDALNDLNNLSGIKTIFTGFHHFKPKEVYEIVKNAKQTNQTICIFDYVPNKVLTIILFPITFIISIIQFYILSFFVRPYSILQLLFTNIFPIIPLIAAWDGFVSGLRKYSANELREITNELNTQSYKIDIGEDFGFAKSTPMVYLIGAPLNEKIN